MGPNHNYPQNEKYVSQHQSCYLGKEMGCCIFRPITIVTEDPDVVMCTNVGGTVISSTYYRLEINSDGLLYVKDNKLYYESVRFCWLNCKWLRRVWHVSEVKRVEVITPDSGREMNYGLKIVMQNESRQTTTLEASAAMNEAVNFRTQLIQHIKKG